MTTKTVSPPYTTYKSFINFINGLRENGMPSHITRDVLHGSNSGKATMASSLKYLKLVDGSDKPTSALVQLVESESNYTDNLKEIIHSSYPFMSEGSVDLANTTTDKLVHEFKELNASGSTITKCMAFFLSACKAANIEVSSYVKAPAPERRKSPVTKKKAQNSTNEENAENETNTNKEEPGYVPFEIQIPGAKPVKISVPTDLTDAQWEMFLNVQKIYLDQFRKVQKESAANLDSEEELESDEV